MKHIGIATLGALILMSATALADEHHHGSGPSPGGEAPHAGGAAPRGGEEMPHMGGGGMPRGGPMSSPESRPSGMETFHRGGPVSNGGYNARMETRHEPMAEGLNRRGNETRHAVTGTFGRMENRRAPSFENRTGRYGNAAGTETNNRRVETRHTATFGSTENRRPPSPANRTGRYGNATATERRAPAYHGEQPNYGHGANGLGRRPSYWNNRPRQFNRADYQRNYTARNRFRYGAYRRPAGWFYRRWAYGDRLPAIFWTRNYWLTDWWWFDLPIPPIGFVWVRYGDDALLINLYTGEILQVAYGIFY